MSWVCVQAAGTRSDFSNKIPIMFLLYFIRRTYSLLIRARVQFLFLPLGVPGELLRIHVTLIYKFPVPVSSENGKWRLSDDSPERCSARL